MAQRTVKQPVGKTSVPLEDIKRAVKTVRETKQAARQERDRKVRVAAGLMKQVSDPSRLLMLLTLAEGERNVGELCDVIGQRQPATSHHISLMRHGRLVEPHRNGKHVYYRITDQGRMLAGAVRGMAEAGNGRAGG